MIAATVCQFALADPEMPSARNASFGAGRRVAQRRQILALESFGVRPSAIGWFADCDASTARRWIARATAGEPLRDKPRSGRPRLFDLGQRLRTVAFYCHGASAVKPDLSG